MSYTFVYSEIITFKFEIKCLIPQVKLWTQCTGSLNRTITSNFPIPVSLQPDGANNDNENFKRFNLA